MLGGMKVRQVVLAAALVSGCGGKSVAPLAPAPVPTPVVPTPTPVEATPAPVEATPPVASPPPPVAPIAGTTIGTAHPLVVEAIARTGAWAVICQARTDTNGDGKIAIHVGHHGDTWGDTLVPYLAPGSGPGEPIEALVGWSKDDRWVVALRGGALALYDAGRHAWTEVPGADLRDDDVPLGPPRAASIAPDGAYLTYFRDDETVVIRELATGRERPVKVAGARLWRAEIDDGGRHARVYAIRKDSDGDGALTWPRIRTSLSKRGCRGPIMSYSTGGWEGDKPDDLWLDLASATISSTPPPPAPEPADGPDKGEVGGRQVLAIDAAGRKLLAPADTRRDIPNGPLDWVGP